MPLPISITGLSIRIDAVAHFPIGILEAQSRHPSHQLEESKPKDFSNDWSSVSPGDFSPGRWEKSGSIEACWLQIQAQHKLFDDYLRGGCAGCWTKCFGLKTLAVSTGYRLDRRREFDDEAMPEQ